MFLVTARAGYGPAHQPVLLTAVGRTSAMLDFFGLEPQRGALFALGAVVPVEVVPLGETVWRLG